MKRILKSIISISLMVSMLAISLCGCAKKKDANAIALNDAVNNSINYVFRENMIPNLEGIENPILMGNYENVILSYFKGNLNYFATLDKNGELSELFTVSDDYKVERGVLGKNGNIYCLCHKVIENENTDSGEFGDSGEFVGEEFAVEEVAGEEISDEEVVVEETEDEGVAADEGIMEDAENAEADGIVEAEGSAEDEGIAEEEGIVEEDMPAEMEMPKDYGQASFLLSYSMTGHCFFEADLSEAFASISSEGDYFYINDIVELNGEVYISGAFGVIIVDSMGQCKDAISNTNLDKRIRSLEGLFVDKEDNLLGMAYYNDAFNSVEGSSYILAKLDPENLSVLETFSMSSAYYGGHMSTSPGYDCLYSQGSGGLMNLDLDTYVPTKVMDFVASDMDIYSFNYVYAFDKETLAAVYMSQTTAGMAVSIFNKVDPNTIKNKQTVTVGMLMTDYYVRQHVLEANKSSDKYRYTIIDYDSLYPGSMSEKLQQINKDAAAGDLPDVLLVSPAFPIDIYISKHLLADLYPFIEADADVDINNMLPNVLEAYSENGQLYQLVPSFSIKTLLTKESYVNGATSWNIAEADAMWEKLGYDKEFISEAGRWDILSKILSNSKDSFINWDEGTCNFDNEDFIHTLEFLKRFPETFEYDWDNIDWDEDSAKYFNGKTIAAQTSIWNYRNFNNERKGTWGGDCTLIGYPSMNGNGSVIVPNLAFAISDLSKCKDGAWEFIKYYMTEDYLSNAEEQYFIPNDMDALLLSEQQSMERPFYTDFMTGEKVYYDQTYYIAGNNIPISPMTEEEAKYLTNFILSVNTPYREDANLLSIVEEEAGAYFAGQKSAQTVAEIIQSRVSLYLAESR